MRAWTVNCTEDGNFLLDENGNSIANIYEQAVIPVIQGAPKLLDCVMEILLTPAPADNDYALGIRVVLKRTLEEMGYRVKEHLIVGPNQARAA
jgi:hypothetical protein